MIIVSGGRLPLIKMELNKMERKIEKAVLYDAQNRMIGRFYVSEKSFNGCEILNSKDISFFQMEYNPNEKRWQFGCYFKQTKDDKLIGDVYKDINLDGQFNILFIFDEFGNAQAEAVYFNGSWNPAVISDDSLSAKVTMIDEKENIDMDMIFNFEKGWIPAP